MSIWRHWRYVIVVIWPDGTERRLPRGDYWTRGGAQAAANELAAIVDRDPSLLLRHRFEVERADRP